MLHNHSWLSFFPFSSFQTMLWWRSSFNHKFKYQQTSENRPQLPRIAAANMHSTYKVAMRGILLPWRYESVEKDGFPRRDIFDRLSCRVSIGSACAQFFCRRQWLFNVISMKKATKCTAVTHSAGSCVCLNITRFWHDRRVIFSRLCVRGEFDIIVSTPMNATVESVSLNLAF